MAKQVLHHVGRIGAQHHHLAVRHVDHAHQAIGDRKAQRRKQQHAAEAESGKHRASRFVIGQAFVYGMHRGGDHLAHIRVSLAAGQQAARKQILHVRTGAACQIACRLHPHCRIAAEQLDAGANLDQQFMNLGILLDLFRLLYQRQRRFAGIGLAQGFCRLQAHRRIRGFQVQRGDRRIQLVAHAVVVDHVLRIVRQCHREAGGRIDRAFVVDDIDFFSGVLDLVILQAVQERDHRSVTGRHHGGQFRDPLIVVAGRQSHHVLFGQRVCSPGGEHQPDQNCLRDIFCDVHLLPKKAVVPKLIPNAGKTALGAAVAETATATAR